MKLTKAKTNSHPQATMSIIQTDEKTTLSQPLVNNFDEIGINKKWNP